MKPARTATDPRNRLIQQIHVAKRELGLAEAEYRALLAGATGKESCSAMGPSELSAVIEALKKLGFKTTFKGAPDGKKSARKVIRLIFGLWTECARRGVIESGERKALFSFVQRMTGINHPDWLDNSQANKVVEALKAMRDRAKAEA